LKQRGGGNSLIGFCSWRPQNAIAAARASWKTVLPSELTFLVEGDTWIMDKEDGEKKYIIIVQRQDELFMLAMRLIYTKIGATEGDESSIFAAAKTMTLDTQKECLDYIKDIISIVHLEQDLTSSQLKDTKFDKLLKVNSNGMLNEPFLHLLINPQRVQNQFVSNMAMILYLLKKNDVLDSIKDDIDQLSLLAVRYDSVTKANALANTSIDLRDGPNIVINTSDVTTMFGTNISDKSKMFMLNFLLRCVGKYYDKDSIKTYTIEDLNVSSLPRTMPLADRYALLSAIIYYSYNNGSRTSILSDISKLLFKNSSKSILDLTNYNNSEFTTNAVRYVLHIVYHIEQAEKLYATPSEAQSSLPETEGSTV
jgi:hypothetical protein